MRSLALYIMLLSLGLGCSVGPDYKRPKTAAVAAFSNADNGQLVEGPTTLALWWNNFRDPMLDSLVARAIKSNLDLRIAVGRVREARAARGVAAGDLWPQIDAKGSYTRFEQSANGPFGSPAGSTSGDQYQLGFDARWEIDIFGGKRRALEAARADLEAIDERQRDVLVTLLGDVAQTYIDLRGYQARLNIATENIKAQSAAVEIAQSRSRAGVGNELDISQATALLATTKAQVPLLQSLVKASMHRLGVLVGQPPASLYEELLKVEPIPAVPEKIATGLPSELIRRRPDVRAAERELAAATARIGVAKGEYFPKVSLLGGFGYEALDADKLFDSDSRFWSLGPSVRWPIFAGGKIRAAVNVQNARQEQALARYEKTILTALEDTENAMVGLLNEQIRRRHLADAVAANRRALELANNRYRDGLADFLNVVDAQRSLYVTEDQWVQSERSVSVNLISLYKALGGGWEKETL